MRLTNDGQIGNIGQEPSSSCVRSRNMAPRWSAGSVAGTPICAGAGRFDGSAQLWDMTNMHVD
jgi:hypothetical protein